MDLNESKRGLSLTLSNLEIKSEKGVIMGRKNEPISLNRWSLSDCSQLLDFVQAPFLEEADQDYGALIIGNELQLLALAVLSHHFSVFEQFVE